MLSPPGQPRLLVAFTSCHRFSGKFNVREGAIDVVVDADGVELASGEHWPLEEVLVAWGDSREEQILCVFNACTGRRTTRAPESAWRL